MPHTQDISVNEKKVHLISLGCARNRADSEVMLGGLMESGWQITSNAKQADAVVVNTCGFIGPAKQESIDMILAIAELKKDKPDMKLVVSGCLSQRYKTQLLKGLPEVDFFIGTDEFTRLPTLLNEPPEKGAIFAKRTNYLFDGELPKLNTLSKRSAYVKVAEGCQHNCSFCIIPAIRGPLRSRPIQSVVREVKKLVTQGVLEVNLIAQDLAAYGRDVKDVDLLDLLKATVEIDGLRWVRLLYVYPENISDEFLDFFAAEEKIVKYLDIPVQHGSNSVLERMNRVVTSEEIRQTIQKVRKKVPSASVRTTVMVGFPGETEAEYQELKTFVEDMKFDHLGCFAYSQEEGTVAGRMEDQIEEDVKERRLEEIMRIQQEISREAHEELVGQTFDVLVVGPSAETDLLFEGRLSTQAPEVDGVTYINDGDVQAGVIQRVLITEAHDYDLVGRIVK